MVTWGEYYSFAAGEIEAIGTSETQASNFPFVLTVYLKSGVKMSVSYADQGSRSRAKRDLEKQIDREMRSASEGVITKLFIVQDSLNRMDKRQLRIWRQLRELLNLKTEDQEAD